MQFVAGLVICRLSESGIIWGNMKHRIHTSILALLAASTLMVPAQSTTNAVQAPKKPHPWVDGPVERGRYSSAVSELWRQGDFASLERMGNELRTKKLKSSDGMWKLSEFYQGMGIIGSGDAGFKAAEQQVKVWLTKYPESVTAPIAQARILFNHAWFFRGSYYANTITDNGQAKFTKYLAEANDVLEKSKARCSICPEWYLTMLGVGQGQGWDKAKFDQIFEEGVKLAPDFYELYFARATSLLPRWYGKEGDWQAFAEAQAKAYGAEIYPRIVWSLEKNYPDTLFTDGAVSWPQMKAGFKKMLTDYPDSNWNLNSFCKHACLAGDRATAKQLFERIGPRRHSVLWTQTDFNKWKTWTTKSE